MNCGELQRGNTALNIDGKGVGPGRNSYISEEVNVWKELSSTLE